VETPSHAAERGHRRQARDNRPRAKSSQIVPFGVTNGNRRCFMPAMTLGRSQNPVQLRVTCKPVSERLKSTNRARGLGGVRVRICLTLTAASASFANISK